MAINVKMITEIVYSKKTLVTNVLFKHCKRQMSVRFNLSFDRYLFTWFLFFVFCLASFIDAVFVIGEQYNVKYCDVKVSLDYSMWYKLVLL